MSWNQLKPWYNINSEYLESCKRKSQKLQKLALMIRQSYFRTR